MFEVCPRFLARELHMGFFFFFFFLGGGGGLKDLDLGSEAKNPIFYGLFFRSQKWKI